MVSQIYLDSVLSKEMRLELKQLQTFFPGINFERRRQSKINLSECRASSSLKFTVTDCHLDDTLCLLLYVLLVSHLIVQIIAIHLDWILQPLQF
jgi:hypothetical protein